MEAPSSYLIASWLARAGRRHRRHTTPLRAPPHWRLPHRRVPPAHRHRHRDRRSRLQAPPHHHGEPGQRARRGRRRSATDNALSAATDQLTPDSRSDCPRANRHLSLPKTRHLVVGSVALALFGSSPAGCRRLNAVSARSIRCRCCSTWPRCWDEKW